MKQKDYYLLVALLILALMAIFSVRRVEIAPGYHSTEAELELGATIYYQNCRECHGCVNTPPIASADAARMQQGR